jgi:hypothetical protein
LAIAESRHEQIVSTTNLLARPVNRRAKIIRAAG